MRMETRKRSQIPVLQKTNKRLKQSRNGDARNGRNGHEKASGSKDKASLLELTPSRSVEELAVRVLEAAPEGLKLQVGNKRPVEEPALARPWLNPTQFDRPAFLLNFPFSYATGSPNNPWMTDLSSDKRQPDFKRAAVQFLQLYQNISAEG